MDDPFAFIAPNFRSSVSSQQYQLRRSLFARQDEHFSPEASRRPPSTSAASADAHRIVSVPETPKLNAGASPSEEDFQAPNLGFSQEGNRSPEIEEILSGGEDRLREVGGEPPSVGAKRSPEKQSPIADQPSSSKRIRVSGGGGFSRLVNTPNLPTRDERQLKRKKNLGKLKGNIGTVVIEDSDDDQIEENCAENAAGDLSREERRELEDYEESENRSRSKPVDDDDGWQLVLEVLALLAMEGREDHHHHYGEVDFMIRLFNLSA